MLSSAYVYAQDSVCAVVKIEIKQELTLERQAFDAEMKINNALDNLALENVKVVVNFEDENGVPVLATSDSSNINAKFFIRVASMDKISDVDGAGAVAPSTTATIHWLIIPAPGAAEDAPLGKIYMVGATLTYAAGGEEEEIQVVPDRIVVKPLPKLTLDYFLEQDVFADDPFTDAIEPSIPFTLGVRIKNNGQAPATNVKIDSAQPKIVENKQGLLIGFEIISSFVSDQPAAKTLLINFGDIPPDNAKVGRWQMITTLDGKFTEFKAEFTHADELGGELTSLLEATNAHFLIKDVLVDVPGRDSILDFLADDGDAIRVYESGNVDTEVTDQSDSAALALMGSSGAYQQYSLTVPPTAGFVYARLPDDLNFQGSKVIQEAIRSDGKRISLHNVWFSKKKNSSNQFEHFLNLFDANTTGSYTLLLGNRQDVPLPPVLQFIPDRRVKEGNQLSYLVEASDPNGTIPVVVIDPVPPGVQFYLDNTANGLATYIFDWTPAAGQAGRYEITYTASDGQLTGSRKAIIDVLPNNDIDNDGMDDQWELDNFGTLDRDGTGDFDFDGISDLDEYLNDTDPTDGPPTGPEAPVIESPLYGDEVRTLQPTMTIRNSVVDPPRPLTYDFELYSDEAMTTLVDSAIGTPEQLGLTTSWQVQQNLVENADYYWRARAYDNFLYSEWVNGAFFVNNFDEPPGAFEINSPADGGEVDNFNPTLEVMNSVDPDRDAVLYRFEVFADSQLTVPVASVDGIAAGAEGVTAWTVDVALAENTYYYWRVMATDEDDLSVQSAAAAFFVNTFNDVPTVPVVQSPVSGAEVAQTNVTLVVENGFDPDNQSLNYYFELDTVSTFDGADLLQSGPLAEGLDTTAWSVNGLREDTRYYWRAKASDGIGESAWAQANFFVNTVNSPPSTPTIANPGDQAWVASLTPTLEVNPATDPDGDVISYRFELYQDAGMTTRLAEHLSTTREWLLTTPLTDNVWYYWRARSEDEHGAVSEWSSLVSFFVDDNGVNDTPVIELLEPAEDFININNEVEIRWNDADPDGNASIALYYDTDASGTDGVLIVDGLSEDADAEADRYLWNTTSLPNGTYYVYAVIDDGNTHSHHYATGAVKLEPVEVIVDNADTDTVIAVGQWTSSTAVSGFHGQDYFSHEANGIPASATVVDNADLAFSTLGDWPLSTMVSGYYGADYQSHAPNGSPVGSVILDNGGAQFTTTGAWEHSIAAGGYEGQDYQYHAPNGESAGERVIDDNDPDVTVVGDWSYSKRYDRHEHYRDRKDRRDDDRGHKDGKRIDKGRRGDRDDHDDRRRGDDKHDRDNDRRDGDRGWKDKNDCDDRDDDRRKKGRDHKRHGDQRDCDDKDDKHDRGRNSNYRYHEAGTGENRFGWNFKAESTRYKVYARWQPHKKRATDAKYEVQHQNGSTVVVVNQRKHSKRWFLLGEYDFKLGRHYSVTLSDDANGYVVADAVKLVPVTAEPNSAIWTFAPENSGDYHVYAKWTSHENPASNAKYSVADDNGTSMVEANQRENGGEWSLLGTFSYSAGREYDVRLTDQADGHVVADAIRFVPMNAPANTAIWSFNIEESGEYLVYARWTGHENHAGNAKYLVASDDEPALVTVNQQENGGQWNLLGVFNYSQGEDYEVRLTDEADGNVVADAVMVVPVDQAFNYFTWNVVVPATGQYNVYVRWTAHPNRATNAEYTLNDNSGETSAIVNQQQNGGQWNLVGVFDFTLGVPYSVTLTDRADGFVVADAIRLVPVNQE